MKKITKLTKNNKIHKEGFDAGYKKARKQLEREIIKKIDYIFKDHYWDSFEPDRELLLKHWKFILDLLRPLHNVI